ncbi:conserved hypothetical protein [uncultured Desulfobacterium sp.]|uniref:RNA-binding protein n=1 Tax=uncultured Desulfobacterium sp. TaxID=201089 RepID=A0A445MVJ8_9BACT|nr:conserved hypothetical protein [uncultured Desulfobacterium sp.]
MCESNAYIITSGKEQNIIEGVALMEIKGSLIRLVSLFGEERVIEARVKSLSLVDHKIILEPIS